MQLFYLDLNEDSECYRGISKIKIRGRYAIIFMSVLAQFLFSFVKEISFIISFIVIFILARNNLLTPLWQELIHLNGFSLIDVSVVFLASLVSSRSYLKVAKEINNRISSFDDGTIHWYLLRKEMLIEQVSFVINIFAFFLAMIFIAEPLKHLWAINLIYFLFCINNHLQSRVANSVSGNSFLFRYAYTRFFLQQRWLNSENFPAVIGYSAIIVLITLIINGKGQIHLPTNINIQFFSNGIFHIDIIKAFAAGVAGYHLGLSTCSYTFGLKEIQEPTVCILVDPAGVKNQMDRTVNSKTLVLFLFLLFSNFETR